MLTKELKTKEEIFKVLEEARNSGNDDLLPAMFHGTDCSLIEIDTPERKRIGNACETIIELLVELYKANAVNPSDERLYELRDSFGTSGLAYQTACLRKENNPHYRYGDFYVTNNPKRAIGYSGEAWIAGETGWTTNRLVEGTQALGLALPDNKTFNEAFALFSKRKQSEKSPAVLIVTGGKASALYTEGGTNIKEDSGGNFAKEIKGIKNNHLFADSYRLDIDGSEKIFIIKEEHYPQLLGAWKEFSNSGKKC